jgi:hypothetical protein
MITITQKGDINAPGPDNTGDHGLDKTILQTPPRTSDSVEPQKARRPVVRGQSARSDATSHWKIARRSRGFAGPSVSLSWIERSIGCATAKSFPFDPGHSDEVRNSDSTDS